MSNNIVTSKVNLSPSATASRHFIEWLPLLLGLAVLYLPTYFRLANGLWGTSDQAQGPLILMLVLFLFWKQREYLRAIPGERTWPLLGSLFFAIGMVLYVVGRSQDILMFEIGSQIPVLAGTLLLTRGMKTLKAMWFPLFFMIFMVPLPGFFIDAVTLPMKIAVSYVADNVLFRCGYPIARTGVILQIGQFQLFVADACAGMHTLISLEALGLLYLNLVKHDSATRNLILAILIVPISFTANVIRVMTLILITYYFGDAAGQGFVHQFAGLVLVVVALALVMSVDSLLQHIVKRRVGA
jgi:exosortase B